MVNSSKLLNKILIFLGSNSAKGVDSIDSSRSQNQPRAPRFNHQQEGWQNLRN